MWENTHNIPSQTRTHLVSHFVWLDMVRDKVRDKGSSILQRTHILPNKFLFRIILAPKCPN